MHVGARLEGNLDFAMGELDIQGLPSRSEEREKSVYIAVVTVAGIRGGRLEQPAGECALIIR